MIHQACTFECKRAVSNEDRIDDASGQQTVSIGLTVVFRYLSSWATITGCETAHMTPLHVDDTTLYAYGGTDVLPYVLCFGKFGISMRCRGFVCRLERECVCVCVCVHSHDDQAESPAL